jgi:excisionase family DNA binding protein
MAEQNKLPKFPIRVSVSEASRLFGITSTTIRQAIKNQQLRYIVVRGRYKINFESLVDWSQKNTRRRLKLEREGLGQYVEKWKIKNKLYSPSEENVK